MKELSIEEKAERYDEAIKKVNDYYEGKTKLYSDVDKTLDYLFPELKESEDERIRKDIERAISVALDYSYFDKETANNCLAWIEKQGKISDKIVERARTEKQRILVTESDGVANIDWDTRSLQDAKFLMEYGLNYIKKKLEKQGEQKPADKVKPKFHKGEWVTDGTSVFQIVKIESEWYIADDGERVCFDVVHQYYHLWTIQDAKVGDVLVSESKCGLNTWYCIFKSLDDDESMTVHCYIGRDGRFQTMEELCHDKDPRDVKPATKEQHDLLFSKMKEAGYEWDAEKKKLKKIE